MCCRAEAEAEQQRRADAEAALQRRRSEKQASLPPEPSAGERCAIVRVRLPDGTNHQRRFLPTHKVQHVYDFVDGLEGCGYHRYSLACGFPRRVYGADTLDTTLEDAGLVPQGLLFVQQEDE